MKRYLVFAGYNYYPSGGWHDYKGDADTLENANAVFDSHNADNWKRFEWSHIVDTTTGQDVAWWRRHGWLDSTPEVTP